MFLIIRNYYHYYYDRKYGVESKLRGIVWNGQMMEGVVR
jgi:hypothetical protein